MIKFSIRPNPPSRIRPFLLAFALLFLFANLALATDFSSQKRFTGFPENLWGYGLNFGEPTGVRANYFLDWKHALNFNVGYSFAKVLTGSANYLWYGYNANDRVLKKDFWNSLIFYGGGGLMAGPGLPGCDTGDKFQLGIQGVGGVEYLFTGSPWSVRMEVLPQYLIMGRSNFNLGMGFGITYYLFDKAKPRRMDFSKKPQKSSDQKEIDTSEFEDDGSEFQ